MAQLPKSWPARSGGKESAGGRDEAETVQASRGCWCSRNPVPRPSGSLPGPACYRHGNHSEAAHEHSTSAPLAFEPRWLLSGWPWARLLSLGCLHKCHRLDGLNSRNSSAPSSSCWVQFLIRSLFMAFPSCCAHVAMKKRYVLCLSVRSQPHRALPVRLY